MAQLPPKIPNMSPSWPDFSSHQKMPPSFGSMSNINATTATNNNINTNHYNHQHNQNPSWVDEFLDFSSARRGAHRRSVSDSVTFLEAPMLDEDCHGGKVLHSNNNDKYEFDKFDDEQFMSMFNDEISGVHNMPPTLSSSNPSSPSDQNNFINDENEKETKDKQENYKEREVEEEEQQNKKKKKKKKKTEEDDIDENNHHLQQQQLKNEPDEVESQCKLEISQPTNNASSNDRITDPKRVKR